MNHSTFRALSLSYKNAPVSIREMIALDEAVIKNILAEITDVIPVEELFILSTCNRTEVYYIATEDLSENIISFIGIKRGLPDMAAYKTYFEFFEAGQAVLQLFRVSLGLEAQVVGDMQISNQVKRAYQWTADANLAGPFMHRLLHAIFFSSKRVAQETSFRDGAASVSYVASELVQTLGESVVDPKVLVLGLGEIGEDVCRHLAGTGLDVSIANRTRSKAEVIAAECQLNISDFENVSEAIASADIVICSIAKSEPFITQDQVKEQHSEGFKYFIDLSMPRSIEPEVDEVPGVALYNIDDIHAKASATLTKRVAAIPAVEAIINEAILDFNDWAKEMVVSPTIHKLKRALEDIRQEELSRYLKHADKDQAALAEKLSKSLTQKIMKLPVLQLKAACKRGEAETLIDVLNDLFDLEKQSQQR